MSLTITLPAPTTTVRGGIQFIDGEATVASLSAGARGFLETIGATIQDAGAPAAAASDPTTADEARAMTIAQLRDLAGRRDVDLPSKAKHAEIADAVVSALFPEV